MLNNEKHKVVNVSDRLLQKNHHNPGDFRLLIVNIASLTSIMVTGLQMLSIAICYGGGKIPWNSKSNITG